MESHSPDVVLNRLQGVWFPTHVSLDGQLVATFEPALPTPQSPYLWLLTVVGDTFHITSNAEYYASGGMLRMGPEPGRLTYEIPQLPLEAHPQYAYQLSGDELFMQSGGFPWSGKYDSVAAIRYVRVASVPTPEMVALIEGVMRNCGWFPGRGGSLKVGK
jgi:hypothetical protein